MPAGGLIYLCMAWGYPLESGWRISFYFLEQFAEVVYVLKPAQCRSFGNRELAADQQVLSLIDPIVIDVAVQGLPDAFLEQSAQIGCVKSDALRDLGHLHWRMIVPLYVLDCFLHGRMPVQRVIVINKETEQIGQDEQDQPAHLKLEAICLARPLIVELAKQIFQFGMVTDMAVDGEWQDNLLFVVHFMDRQGYRIRCHRIGAVNVRLS